jgi:DNA polymerase-3 subunit epsilon
VTPADTAQTGLISEQLSQAQAPAEALRALDRRFTAGTPYLLVAQHAATEAQHHPQPARALPGALRRELLDRVLILSEALQVPKISSGQVGEAIQFRRAAG